MHNCADKFSLPNPKSQSSNHPSSLCFAMDEMGNVSRSRGDVGREMENFLPFCSTLLTVQGKTFLTGLIRLDGKRRIGLERGMRRKLGLSSLSAAAFIGAAAKSLIAVQPDDVSATEISQCGELARAWALG